jgi:hypothetical protein
MLLALLANGHGLNWWCVFFHSCLRFLPISFGIYACLPTGQLSQQTAQGYLSSCCTLTCFTHVEGKRSLVDCSSFWGRGLAKLSLISLNVDEAAATLAMARSSLLLTTGF